MNAMLDTYLSSALIATAVALRIAYGARVRAHGAARFSRLDAAGSSPLLGRSSMEATYWGVAPLARALARAGVSANTVTATSLVFGAAAGTAIALEHLGVAAWLAAMSALCDLLDGFVARESGTTSEAGGTFDAAADRYNEFFFLAGLALLYSDALPVLCLVLATVHGSFMVSYASAKAEALDASVPRGYMRRPERATYLTAGVALSPIAAAAATSLDTTPWVAATAPVVAMLVVVGVGANVSAIRRLTCIARSVNHREHDRPEGSERHTDTPVRVVG